MDEGSKKVGEFESGESESSPAAVVSPFSLQKIEELEEFLDAGTSARKGRPAGVRNKPPAEGGLSSAELFMDQIIELMLLNPGIKKTDIAREMGRTPAWVYIVTNSDAFQMRLRVVQEKYKTKVADEVLDKVRAVAESSLDVMLDKLEYKLVSFEQAQKAATASLAALGYGGNSKSGSVNLQVNVGGFDQRDIEAARAKAKSLRIEENVAVSADD